MLSGFSAENLRVYDILRHYDDSTKSAYLYFSPANPDYAAIFLGEKPEAVQQKYEERLREIDRSYTLTLLASVEAYFMVDYVLRCKIRKKDPVSKALREIYRKKEERANLIDDIVLRGWNRNAVIPPRLLNELIRAFELRHWLAHGRWWVLKIGKPEFDFASLYGLASQILGAFPLNTI